MPDAYPQMGNTLLKSSAVMVYTVDVYHLVLYGFKRSKKQKEEFETKGILPWKEDEIPWERKKHLN